MVAPSMTRASNAPDDILMAQVLPRLRFETSPYVLARRYRAHRLQSSMAVSALHANSSHPSRNSAPKSSKNRAGAREKISVVPVADVAIEPDVDLPGLALRLHEVGQHGVRALGYGLDVPAQDLHEAGDLLAQGALVDGRALAVGDDNATVDDDRLHSAAGLREHDLAGNAVERNERRIGEIDDRKIGGHTWPQSADLSLQSRGTRAADRRRPDGIGSGRGTELRLRDRGKAGEQLHRLEHVLRIAAAAVVTAERRPQSLAQISADRRYPAAGLEIADRIEDDVRARFRDAVHFGGQHPDAVCEIHARGQQTDALEVRDQRAPVFGRVRLPRDQRHRAGFIEVRVDGELFSIRQVREFPQQFRCAPLGTGRAERQGDARMPTALRTYDVAQQFRQIDALERLDRASKRTPLLRRHHLLPEGNRLRPGRVGKLQCEYAANADVLVGLEDRFQMLLIERVDGGEVLHGRHPATQAFERAD